jgi:hypothetical protein
VYEDGFDEARMNQTIQLDQLDSTPDVQRTARRAIGREFLTEDERYTKSLEDRLTAMENTLQTQQHILQLQSSLNELNGSDLQTRKRSRSPVDLPEPPIMIDKTMVVKDNAHDVLCWEWRKDFRQVNRDPDDYWKASNYPEEVKPNLKELVYWEHLMPMCLNPKVITYNYVKIIKMLLKGSGLDA